MQSLDALAGADIVDAVGREHRHRSHLLDLVSPTPGRRLFGPDVTISYFPACRAALPPERHSFKRLFYDAIASGADGRVLVLASNGYSDASLGGGQSCRVSKPIGSPAFSRTGSCATSPSWSTTTSPSIAAARQRGRAATSSPRTRRTVRW